jgi:branched-chain amino acid transport system ATP-binding protein
MSLLETSGLTAFYGDFQALFGIDFRIEKGETVAIIGSNGAGKSTFLRSITGIIANQPDAIRWDGAPIGNQPANRIVAHGIAMVPEGRRLFPSLTVEENLRIGAYARSGDWTVERVIELFPFIAQRRKAPATALSGGEQQMVAIGRALMSNPRLLLCDEISLGLAPAIIKNIYDALPTICEGGTTLLIVEQDIRQALDIADRVYCFQEGRVTLEGRPADLTHDQIREAYFGM